jgi:hypothetical protein
MQNQDRYFVVWYASKCQDSETSNPDDETLFRAGLETVHHLIWDWRTNLFVVLYETITCPGYLEYKP